MNIANAELSYLGSPANTETRGVTWRDSNDPASPGVLLRRVTGAVLNSKFHHNYIGASTVQGDKIVFENNEFYENALHGLNIDDFSIGDGSDSTVEVKNNRAYSNAGHGIYLSRGVTNLTLADNKSYKNLGHGFLIDAGSSIPASPSTNNTFTTNEAYENQQLGMRLLESNTNNVLNNRFYRNIGGGISIEKKSTANNIVSNQLFENQKNGVDLRDTADANIVASNVISKNVDNGIYIRSSNNTVNNNNISGNQKAGVAFLSETGTPVQNNQFTGNTVAGNGTSGVDVRGASGSKIEGNQIYGNLQHGVYLTLGAINSVVTRNTIYSNKGYGIRCSDLSAFSNKWSENSLFDNETGGVAVTDGANASISQAVSISVKVRVVTGSAQPGATVEIFTDNNGQGRYYHGSTVVQPDGKFSFTLTDGKWKGAQITTVVIDAQGNASRFSSGELAPALPDNVYMPLVRR
jgi:parallel beta-helix repeat protein